MSDTTTLGVGMLGSGFMAKAHAKALLDAAMLRERRLRPQLVSIAGRNTTALAHASKLFGWQRHTLDLQELIDDPQIGLFVNAAPNALHAQSTIAAAKAGKHVLCEKPLSTEAEQAFAMWQAAENAGVLHLCGFNFRFTPAVRLAYEMIDAGEIGEIVHFRAQFLVSSALEQQGITWRDRGSEAGGAVGDLGSHIVDLMRWLAGELVAVTASTRTLIAERDSEHIEVDDSFNALIELASGASGTLEASRIAGGIGSRCAFEVDGTQGTLQFTSERINDLQWTSRDHVAKTIRVTGKSHPFMSLWWPHPGHELGWGDTFTHQIDHLLDVIEGKAPLTPLAADFQDGYRCAEICDAIQRSAGIRAPEKISYRHLSQ